MRCLRLVTGNLVVTNYVATPLATHHVFQFAPPLTVPEGRPSVGGGSAAGGHGSGPALNPRVNQDAEVTWLSHAAGYSRS